MTTSVTPTSPPDEAPATAPPPDPYDLIAESERIHAINPSALRSFEHQLIAALKEALHERDMWRTEARSRHSALGAVFAGDLAQVTKERDEAIAALKEATHERDRYLVEALARRSAIPDAISMTRDLARMTKERDDAVALLESLPGDDDSVLVEEKWTERYRYFLAQVTSPLEPVASQTAPMQAVAS
ncbi:MAG: hypothetical protein ACYCST_11200 [Acidimicrobiales bacterium]